MIRIRRSAGRGVSRTRRSAVVGIALAAAALPAIGGIATAQAGERCRAASTVQPCAARRAAAIDARHRWDVGFWGDAYANYNSPQWAYATSGTAVYCRNAHPTYEPSSGRYVGLDGSLHRCP